MKYGINSNKYFHDFFMASTNIKANTNAAKTKIIEYNKHIKNIKTFPPLVSVCFLVKIHIMQYNNYQPYHH